MSVTRIRTLYLIAIALSIIAVVLVLASGLHAGDTRLDDADRPALLTTGIILAAAAAIPALIALIQALVMTARERQWHWFVPLLLLPGATLLVFVVVAPSWARRPTAAVNR
jgi:hypothetical protein